MKRTIEVSTRHTRLFVHAKRLVVERDESVLARIPLSDLGLLILDSSGIGISSGLLSGLAQEGAAVLVCDDKHLPKGLFLPFENNCLHAERVRRQASASRPLEKNLWQRVVRKKIANQAALLREAAGRQRLLVLKKRVKSGDPGNLEAQAAQAYWPLVFAHDLPPEFSPFRRRAHGNPPNCLLNYGYAVLRAATARALVGAGLHSGLGVHHQNRYSGHPLADDMMEPFRPWVDQKVLEILRSGILELNKDTKKVLLEVLTSPATLSSGTTPLFHGLERMAASLAEVYEAFSRGEAAPSAASRLVLPSLSSGANVC